MNFSKINELKPYDLNCNIFDVYSYDGLSMQDLLCQFFTKINECINTSNETIDLTTWLVNEGLKQETVLKITEMLNDGTFENLINVNLFENLNSKIDNVSSQLDHKASKNEVFSMANMGQDIREAMTGGSVAVVGKDTILTENIVDGQITPSKTSFLTHTKNMVNPDELTYGYYVSETGYKTEDSNYAYTNKIKLNKNTDYYVSNYRFICVYNDSGEVLKSEGKKTAGSGVINLTEGSYVIITFHISKVGNGAQLELGSNQTEYEDYKYSFNGKFNIPNNYVNGEMVDFLVKGKNLLDTKKSLKNQYFQGATTNVMIQSDDYDTTEFIKVPKNTNISISPRARLVCLYTDKDPVTGDVEKYIKNTVYNHTLNTGNNEYIRVAYYKSDTDIMQIEINNKVTEFEPYGYNLQGVNVINKNNTNILEGKTLINFGDSIADGVSADYKGYAHRIAENNNMVLYDYANGGATIKVKEDSENNILNQVINAESVNVDYVLFNGYTNDCKTVSNSTNEEYLGEITEGYDNSFNENTFCGAFEKILKTLHEKYIGAKIIYVGTHINYSRDLNSQRIFNDLAIKICKKWGIPVVNMFEEGGLNSFIGVHEELYINDGSHPNALGYDKYYVPIVESKMKSV